MLGKISSLCREEKNRCEPKRPYVPVEVTNIDTLLHDIYMRYIAIDDEDFRIYYRVVQVVFLQMHKAMKRTDRYYRKYSSRVQYAGSHSDRLRINKPDEFDIDINIGMPLNIRKNPRDPAESDFVIEPQDPGFVQLKMGVQYDRLPERFRREWADNSAAARWGDEESYLQRSKFMDWFKGVVDKALNEFMYDNHPLPIFKVDRKYYTVRKGGSGPAVTLFIEGLDRDDFKLDVDLVPSLRFPVDRWPICSQHRPIPKWWCYPRRRGGRRRSNRQNARPGRQASSNFIMVVPKPNKRGRNGHVKNRSWRLTMEDQERMLMHNTNNMRQAIRFMKKFRDAQKMDHIASYRIKTMFFWEAMQHYEDRDFWDNSPAFLFEYMLEKFRIYLLKGRLPNFWDRRDNLLWGIPSSILKGYARKVKKLLDVLEEEPADYSQYIKVAKLLLTRREFRSYSWYLRRYYR